eukprot:GEMP01014757.1.p2 GENE.GEMP01014757.1~~GEMP01014757.1.p2  ORF type:complete len:134 (-),score=0.06 GEMP01014757.1:1132-1533(-)
MWDLRRNKNMACNFRGPLLFVACANWGGGSCGKQQNIYIFSTAYATFLEREDNNNAFFVLSKFYTPCHIGTYAILKGQQQKEKKSNMHIIYICERHDFCEYIYIYIGEAAVTKHAAWEWVAVITTMEIFFICS